MFGPSPSGLCIAEPAERCLLAVLLLVAGISGAGCHDGGALDPYRCDDEQGCEEPLICMGGFCLQPPGVDGAVPVDSGTDSGSDTGLDAGLDSGVDSGLDAGTDAGCTPGPFGVAMSVAAVSSAGNSEWSPSISSDGLELYVETDIPGGVGSDDIWVATRPNTSASFSPLVNLTVVNATSSDGEPELSEDGLSLYFTSNRAAGAGSWDIWVATRPDTSSPFSAPSLALLTAVNSSSSESAPSISADNLTLYFGSSRPGGLGAQDLYVATRTSPTAAFGAPTYLPLLSSPDSDRGFDISSDGLTFYFSSTRPGGVGSTDIWFSTRPDLSSSFSAPSNFGPLNTMDSDSNPSFSPDELTVYFSSDRPGSAGGQDIWVATRPCTP